MTVRRPDNGPHPPHFGRVTPHPACHTGHCATRGEEVDKQPETVAELRERAARIRQHLLALRFDESAPRLLALAKELDARADAIESSTN
jgi:hypothetical protein